MNPLVISIILIITGLLIVAAVSITKGIFYAIDNIRKKLKHRSLNIIHCPYCSTELEIPPGSEGRDARCLGCNQKFSIPAKIKPSNTKNIARRAYLYLRDTPIVVASIILATAIIIASVLNYNTNRYSYHYKSYEYSPDSHRVFDKNTGKLHMRNGKVILDILNNQRIVNE